jgi:hypothetical protein
MNSFLETLRMTTILADGGMGTLLFERTGRLSERNHVYDALTVDAPRLSYSIHRRGLLPHTFRAYTSSHFRCPATTGHRSSDRINCGMSESRPGFSQSSPGIDDSMDDGDFVKEPDGAYNACRHYSTL